MGIEQHAEAAANEVWTESREYHDFVSPSDYRNIITKHIHSAITESTAEQAATIAKQAARIAELEALGPLIEEYGQECSAYGLRQKRAHRDNVRDEITAILKGGD